jgi:hypothetical protein
LPIVTKNLTTNKSSFSLLPQMLWHTTGQACGLRKMKEQGLALYTHKQEPCAIIEHITNVYLK